MRLEVLKLPIVPLGRHGLVKPADRAHAVSEPQSVGVGPDGTAFAVWPHRRNPERVQVTQHDGGREIGGA